MALRDNVYPFSCLGHSVTGTVLSRSAVKG